MKIKPILERAKEEGFALTFDDVRLKTGYADTMPDAVNTETRFSRNVKLKIPIVSAAMDTVTESKMAIALAKLGGIGVIHKNLSVEQQAIQVAIVKHHLNGLIERPVCVKDNDKISSILKMVDEKGYSFQSFPVLNSEDKLVGILTGNDFEFCTNPELTAKEVMTPNIIVARKGTSLSEAYEIMRSRKKKALPLVDENSRLVGLYIISDVKRILTGSAEAYNTDEKGRLRVAASIGTDVESLDRAKRLVEENVDVLVIDTAHGDSRPVMDMLKKLKSMYKVDIVVGNISVGESARRLAEAGADGIKVGQGPGSICTTRIIAGIGRPQVSAVYDCAKVASEFGIPICADGGLTSSGDVVIAIGSGADCVMMGSMLAGTDESPGDTIYLQGRPWKSYRGMGSLGAMESHKGSRERYNQTGTGKSQMIPEGVEGVVPYKGSLKDVVYQYIGGLKRGMGYVGAKDINELKDKSDFDRITKAGLEESHPHGIKITKDAPNYKDVNQS
jgi:IMP dehydrogenase